MSPSPLSCVHLSIAGAALSLAACGGLPNAAGAPESQILAESAGGGEAALEDAVAAARADLAGRLGVGEAALAVLEARRVTWRSGDLGCPEPGMSYPQVLTPGVMVVLVAGGTPYRYHGTPGAALVYCPADRARPPASSGESDR